LALEIPPTPISEISPLVLAAISFKTSFDLSLRGLPDNPPLSEQNLLVKLDGLSVEVLEIINPSILFL
jgi:hypothetical protein